MKYKILRHIIEYPNHYVTNEIQFLEDVKLHTVEFVPVLAVDMNNIYTIGLRMVIKFVLSDIAEHDSRFIAEYIDTHILKEIERHEEETTD